MPPQHYPRRDSNPRQRTEPWQIRSSSVKILTSVLSRKPEYGIARPSRKWFLRQEKRMRDFPDELLSIAGKRKYNRISAGSAVLETMEAVLQRLTSNSSSTTKGKKKCEGTVDGGEEEFKRWKKSKANLCSVHEVLDAHLMHRIFMAVVHETSTLTYVLRGFISDEISAIERSTEGTQGYGQRSRSKSETTLVKNEGIIRLAALLHRLDSITAYWVSHKTFVKNFHGGKPYDESGKVTQVENRCDACILAAIGASARALSDLRALVLYRHEKRRRSSSTEDEVGEYSSCGWSGITDSILSSNLKSTSSNCPRDSPISGQTSATPGSQPSNFSISSSRSRSQEPVLLRFLDGWISALKKDQPETCREESKDLAALLLTYQDKIELYRSEHARLRDAGAEGPTIWREVRITRAVSRSTGRRREELFDLVPGQEEVEFGNHTRYGTPIAYLVPSTLRQGKEAGPKYHRFCTSKDDHLREGSTECSEVAGSAINSGTDESERNSSQLLSSPSHNDFQAFMEHSQALYGKIDHASSSSVYSQDTSVEIEHETNQNTGVPNSSVENISIVLDEQEARRLAQSETVIRDWQARCNLDRPQPVPPEDAEDSDNGNCARLRGVYDDKLPATKPLVPLSTPRTNIPLTPFTHRSAVPQPLCPKSKGSVEDAKYLLQEAGQHVHNNRSFVSALANRKRSETSERRSISMKQNDSQCRFCSGTGCRSCAPFVSDLSSSSVIVSNSPLTDVLTKDCDQKSSECYLPLGYDDHDVKFDNDYNDRASAWTDVSVLTRHPTIASTFSKRVTEEEPPESRSQISVQKNKDISQLDDDPLALERMVDEKLGRLEDLHITSEQEALIMNLPNTKPPRTDFCKKAFGETSTVYKFPTHPGSPDSSASVGITGHSPQISPRQIAHDSAYQCPETPQVLEKRLYNTDRPSYQAWLKNIRSLDNIRDTPLKPSDTTVDSYYSSRTSRYEQVGTPTKSRFDGQKTIPRLETVPEPDGLQDWERHGIEHPREWEEIGVPPVGHVPSPGHVAPPALKLRSFLDRLIDSKKATAARKGKGPITTAMHKNDLKRSQTTCHRTPLQKSTDNEGISTSNDLNLATRGRSASVLHAGQCQQRAGGSRPKRTPRRPPAKDLTAEGNNKECSVRTESYATQITDLLAQWQHESSRASAERGDER